MALNYEFITDKETYLQRTFDLIQKVEGLKLAAYLDSAVPSIPTIGYGFNLRDARIRDEVFTQFGLDANAVTIANDPLAVAREQYYIDALTTAINMPWKKNEDDELRILLDNLMAARAQDLLLVALGMSHEPDLRFDSAIDPRMKAVFDISIDTYETRVDDWLPGIADSKERSVLISLAYNGYINKGNYSPALRQAIIGGNRAEAWFEIRYNSNKNALTALPPADAKGIAKRHYYEAEIFGLYDNVSNVTAVEAKKIYRMFTQHRDTIANYESLYGKAFDGSPGTRLISRPPVGPEGDLPPLLAANADYLSIFQS